MCAIDIRTKQRPPSEVLGPLQLWRSVGYHLTTTTVVSHVEDQNYYTTTLQFEFDFVVIYLVLDQYLSLYLESVPQTRVPFSPRPFLMVGPKGVKLVALELYLVPYH